MEVVPKRHRILPAQCLGVPPQLLIDPQGRAEGRSPFAGGLGVSPNSTNLPPRMGARGLKRVLRQPQTPGSILLHLFVMSFPRSLSS